MAGERIVEGALMEFLTLAYDAAWK
jgi:hypothetical protein